MNSLATIMNMRGKGETKEEDEKDSERDRGGET